LALGLLIVVAVGCSESSSGNNDVPGNVLGSTAGASGLGGAPGGAGGISVGGAGGMITPLGGRAGGPTLPPMTGGSVAAGAGGLSGGSGGAGSGGMTGGAGAAGMPAGAGGSAGTPPMEGGCTPAPSGTFQTTSESGGPGGNYTIFRPTTLGEGGFLHPPVAWGNGLATTPSLYVTQLSEIASHGFVIIANPGTGSDPQVVRQGLEWLLEQNGSGQFAGKLAVDCAGTIGYSMGGGAAVGSGSHPAVKAIVSIHGLQDNAAAASGPILLTTSEGDTFVTKSGFVEPCYNRSTVQPTILASHTAGDHLDPLGDSEDWAPALAWLRYWIYGDQSQKEWFFGDNCMLCDWPDFRRKNHPEWN
jgi:hypothetical protein